MISFDKITFGHINKEKDNEGFYSFLRFTDKQLEFYKNSSEWYDNMSKCSAGVYFSFETDAEEISFDYKIMFSFRTWCTFDFYVNDIYIYTKDIGEQKQGNIKFHIENGQRQKQVIKIYLPYSAILYVNNLNLNGSINFLTAPQKLVYCFGDSITQGFDTYKTSFTYPNLLSNFYGVGILNQGIGGMKFSKGILCDLENLPVPDLITVAYGTNDWTFGDDINSVKKNINEFFDRLNQLYAKVPVSLITPIWRADIKDTAKTGKLRDISYAIKEKAKEFSNISFIDGIRCVPHNISFFGDGKVHPNDEGFLYYANQLIKHKLTIRP